MQSYALTNAEAAKRLMKTETMQAATQAGLNKQWEIFGRKVDQLKAFGQIIRIKEDQIKALEMLIQDQFSWEQHRQGAWCQNRHQVGPATDQAKTMI